MSDQPIKFSDDEVKSKPIKDLGLDAEQQEVSSLMVSPLTSKETTDNELRLRRKQKKSKLGLWFWGSFSSLVIVATGFELYQFIVEMLAFNSGIGYILILMTVIVVSTTAMAIVKNISARRQLKDRVKQRIKLKQFSDSRSFGQAKPLLTEITTEIDSQVDISTHYMNYQNSSNSSHNDNELIEIYTNNVLKKLDQESNALISKHSSECALMVALSPLASLDMLLVAWRSSKMISEVSALYGCPQNFFGRIGLTKSVLKNLMLTGASELVADAGIELLGSSLTATVSARAAQGIGVGILISRLGIQTMHLCRPVEYTELNRPKLSDMRKVLVKNVINKISGKSSTKK